ncbi:lantibiotic dehydratase [Methylobacterium sp. WSM2598]|uniref:lantibiotic dehydratase n=1 Tax=Methylobacterium sp. WSM2598 TaxID=398261 RepID=UPI00037CB1F5|nr:lantibiotic dehydratase [Methylobacterium sp. WSM2598]
MSAVRGLGPAILRVAGWPIETLAPLRAAALTNRVDAWIARDEALLREGAALAGEVRAALRGAEDPARRGALLDLARALRRSARPLPAAAVGRLWGDPSLGEAVRGAAASRLAHAAERARIDAAHAAELARAGAALEAVAREERFRRALCLASPSVFRRLTDPPGDARGRRRLTASLHRYLMRAVGRATPNGLWAGIVLEDAGGGEDVGGGEDARWCARGPLAVAPAPAVTRVAPVLHLFARVLEARARARPWIDATAWRLNPTLRRAGAAWLFGTVAEGIWVTRQVADHAPLGHLRAALAPGEAAAPDAIADALRRRDPALPDETARAWVEAWIGAGILSPSTALPGFYADPWQALDGIVAALPAGEAESWRAVRAALARIAAEIEAGIETLSAEALRARLDAARAPVAALLAGYGLALPDGADVLALDRTAPFRFALSRDLAAAIEARIRAAWAFDRFGLGAVEAEIETERLFGPIAPGCTVPLGDFLAPEAEAEAGLGRRARTWEERAAAPPGSDLARRAREAFGRWERVLAPDPAARRLALPEPEPEPGPGGEPLPAGSALLLVDADGRLRLGGITPEPAFFHGRFAALLGAASDGSDAFLDWLRGALRGIEARHPVRFCDIAIRNHRAPNVTARPASARRALDPLAGGGEALRGLGIGRDARGRPALRAAGLPERLVPAARTAASLAGLDRVAWLLSSVSLCLGRPSLMAPIPPLAREVAEWRHLPRLLLGETVLGPERWTPREAVGAGLAAARGAERFVIWRRFAREAGLPALLYAFAGRGETEVLLAADSPLAIDLLGQDLAAHGPALRLQELLPDPSGFVVRDESGRRYLAELAVAWAGDDAFWAGLAPAAEA